MIELPRFDLEAAACQGHPLDWELLPKKNPKWKYHTQRAVALCLQCPVLAACEALMGKTGPAAGMIQAGKVGRYEGPGG